MYWRCDLRVAPHVRKPLVLWLHIQAYIHYAAAYHVIVGTREYIAHVSYNPESITYCVGTGGFQPWLRNAEELQCRSR